jgi:hypothetical protein
MADAIHSLNDGNGFDLRSKQNRGHGHNTNKEMLRNLSEMSYAPSTDSSVK